MPRPTPAPLAPRHARLCAALAAVAAAFGSLTACEPTRTIPVVYCSKNSQCPADGVHFCNLATQKCEPCDGPCPGSGTTDATTDTSDAVSTPDAVTVDAASSDTAAQDAGVQADTLADAVDDSEEEPDIDTSHTCAGICGKQAPTGCWCDEGCLEFDDCCDDFESICTADTSADADADTAAPVDAGSDATATGG